MWSPTRFDCFSAVAKLYFIISSWITRRIFLKSSAQEQRPLYIQAQNICVSKTRAIKNKKLRDKKPH